MDRTAYSGDYVEKLSTDTMARELVELENSTTIFLENYHSALLQVIIRSQEEDSGVIKRVTLLFFESSGAPVLYCVSYLIRDQLTKEEYYQLTHTTLPIGRIFAMQNMESFIDKRNITTQLTTNEEAAIFLDVQSPLVYEKKYDYYVGQRKIGQIIEVFNEESLIRT